MTARPIRLLLLAAAGAAAAAGCASAPPLDDGAYLDHMPRSILVLPPLNESPSANATYAYLSTITGPLADRGYYVFPVALVDACLRENGLPTPGEMHQVPPARLGEIFGADAVLHIAVTEWGNRYLVLNSSALVSVRARLVDCATGTVLREGTWRASVDSSSGSDNPLAMAVAALVTQVVSSEDGRSREAARRVNAALSSSLLPGPRSPDFAADQARRRADRAERDRVPSRP